MLWFQKSPSDAYNNIISTGGKPVMQNGQMSVNTEVVGSAVNQISVDIADLQTRINRFLALLQEKDQQTSGKFAIVNTLAQKMQKEVDNVKALNEATEQIREVLRRYVEIAEEAVDDSAFRMDD